jgi:DNA-binding IclR family transcriptional regulator
MNAVEAVRSPRRAAALLAHPLRARILRHARVPISASDLARQLGQPRQRVNYHVRQLARDGFLARAGRQRKRNMVEQRYVATARAYVLAPEVLGEVAPAVEAVQDAASAGHLVALCARAQSEIASVVEAATSAGLRVRTLSLQSDLRFESAAQRAAFTSALLEAVSDVVARHSAPFTKDSGEAAPGRPFRLIVGCYPLPGKEAHG